MPIQYTRNTDRTRTQVYQIPQPYWTSANFGPWPVFVCLTQELKMVFTVLKGYKSKDRKEYTTEALCGPQNLKYLLSGPIQKVC